MSVSAPSSVSARGGFEVRCVDVSHVYQVELARVAALTDIQLRVVAGERVALFGPSGSGKSTLTSLLAGLLRPTTGQIWLGGHEVTALTERQLLTLRGRDLGMVLQNPARSLLPYATAEDNVVFAQRPARRTLKGGRGLTPAGELLRSLGLGELIGQRTARLSGGEQQRLSVAVAMACSPRILLADEPTSQLDGHNRDRVVDLLEQVSAQFGTTLIVVTHDPVVADACDRRVTMADGRIVNHGHSGFDAAGSFGVRS